MSLPHERGTPVIVYQGNPSSGDNQLTRTGVLAVPSGDKVIITEISIINTATSARHVKLYSGLSGFALDATSLIHARYLDAYDSSTFYPTDEAFRRIVLESTYQLWCNPGGTGIALSIFGLLVEPQ
jgi:hypothetical protein